MAARSDVTTNSRNDLNSQKTLDDLYSWLRFCSQGLAYNSSAWRGQEHDAEEDFVQEAVVRTFQYSQRPDRKDYSIKSPKHFAATTMRNYREDRRRKDYRLIRLEQLQTTLKDYTTQCDEVDPAELAIE